MNRAASIEELQPLVDLCRVGKLFEVQEWVGQGRPVALPEDTRGRYAKRNPLRITMEKGFHSFVQVLLEAGAPICEGYYNALDHAVELRRPDLARLLLEHGANIRDVSMRSVIDMWNTEMVELFLENGASLTDDNPIAWGFVYKMRPTLGLLKRSVGENPALMKQAELALRFHAGEGNAKWVALLLWAGADPWSRGPSRIEDADLEEDEDDFSNAVELAASGGKMDVLTQKKLLSKADTGRPEAQRLLREACFAKTSEALTYLLSLGFTPRLLPDRGSAAIGMLLHSMSWEISFSACDGLVKERSGIDTSRSREGMKMLHMLVARGARWLPKDKREIADARQCLLKMAPDYVLEFVWLVRQYGAARRRDMRELLRTPSMVRLLGREREQASRLIEGIPENPPDDEGEADRQ